ncbi:MAG: hypothetical protein KAX68_02370, partial [Giesbergeria sp.]|nr:hypothetical protein [Giesbergeria sp.]
NSYPQDRPILTITTIELDWFSRTSPIFSGVRCSPFNFARRGGCLTRVIHRLFRKMGFAAQKIGFLLFF